MTHEFKPGDVVEATVADGRYQECNYQNHNYVYLMRPSNKDMFWGVPRECLRPARRAEPLTDLERAVVEKSIRLRDAHKSITQLGADWVPRLHEAQTDHAVAVDALLAARKPPDPLRGLILVLHNEGDKLSLDARQRLANAIAALEAKDGAA